MGYPEIATSLPCFSTFHLSSGSNSSLVLGTIFSPSKYNSTLVKFQQSRFWEKRVYMIEGVQRNNYVLFYLTGFQWRGGLTPFR